jgi:hypothetical protein
MIASMWVIEGCDGDHLRVNLQRECRAKQIIKTQRKEKKKRKQKKKTYFPFFFLETLSTLFQSGKRKTGKIDALNHISLDPKLTTHESVDLESCPH